MKSVVSGLAFVLAATAMAASAADTGEARKTLKAILPQEAEVELALSAVPPSLRGGAAIYLYGASGFTRFRAGTNGFTCLVNRDAFLYGEAVFKPTCWDPEGARSYVPVMLRVGEMLAADKSADAIKAEIDAGFRNGRFHRPRRTGIAYMLAGDVKLDTATGKITTQTFPNHYMIYAPGVSNADIGQMKNAGAEVEMPFIYDVGAGGSHLAYLIAIPHHLHK